MGGCGYFKVSHRASLYPFPFLLIHWTLLPIYHLFPPLQSTRSILRHRSKKLVVVISCKHANSFCDIKKIFIHQVLLFGGFHNNSALPHSYFIRSMPKRPSWRESSCPERAEQQLDSGVYKSLFIKASDTCFSLTCWFAPLKAIELHLVQIWMSLYQSFLLFTW